MAKKNKIALNEQQESVSEINEEVISNIELINDVTVETEISDNEEIINDEEIKETLLEKTLEEILPDGVNIINEPIIIEKPVEIAKPKRTVDSLSRDEYRTYLRTGRIPE